MYIMIFLFILVLIIVIFITLLFIYPVKIAATFNSEQQRDIYITSSWLNPFLKGHITRHDAKTNLMVDLFGKRILERNLNIKRNAGLGLEGRDYADYVNMAKSLKISNAKLYASYGFSDPADTGILFGAISLLAEYINLDELCNNADFMSDTMYFDISAEAEINLPVSFIRALRRDALYVNTHAVGGSR